MKKYSFAIILSAAIISIFALFFYLVNQHEINVRNQINESYSCILAQINNGEEVISYTQNTFGINNRDKDMKLRMIAENRGYKVTINQEKLIFDDTFTTIVFKKARNNQ